MNEFTASEWIARRTTQVRPHRVYVEYGHYISWSKGAPYSTSTDRLVPLVTELQAHNIQAIPEIVSGPMQLNVNLLVRSTCGDVLYQTNNIRSMSKSEVNPEVMDSVLKWFNPEPEFGFDEDF